MGHTPYPRLDDVTMHAAVLMQIATYGVQSLRELSCPTKLMETVSASFGERKCLY